MDGGCHLGRLAERYLDTVGDYPSLSFEGTAHTSGSMFTRSTRFSTGLRRIGVQPGDRVVVLMANCPEVFVVYQAAWRAGAVVTPVIFLVTAPELRYMVLHSGAAAIVTTPDQLAKVAAATEGLRLPVVVVDGGSSTRGGNGERPADTGDLATIPFAELAAEEPGPLVQRGDDDLAALLYTGGTTGRSKGVALSHSNVFHGAGAARSVTYTSGLNRNITALPLSHSYGLLVTVNNLHAQEPGFTVLMRWFDPAVWVTQAETHRVHTASMVPSMITALLSQPLADHDLSELRNVFSGAAPMPAAVAREFERLVPSAQILEGYGCTETSAIISAHPPAERRFGTVGRAVPGIRIRIVGDDGADQPPGRDGEIVVSGPPVMTGYWQDDEQSAVAVPDGWLHTGDIGHLDADGYLTIVDRKKDLIIRGGYNVYPRDVEDVLVQHPAVSGAAVVGRPDDRLGEEVVAFVALRPGAAAEPPELVAFAKDRLAATKYPRDVRVVEEIPLTSIGKVDRKRLRSLVATEPVADVAR